MPVPQQQTPTEAQLKHLMTESDNVRVQDARSGCEGVLWQVNQRSVIALMGHMTFCIRFEHLVLLTEATSPAPSTLGVIEYRKGDFVEPINEATRAVRHPGQILMAQPLPAGQEVTVQPFDGGVMWTMPADRVRPAERPVRTHGLSPEN